MTLRMLDGDTLDEWSIQIIQQHAPKDEPYWLAYSGGKDSDVLLDLTKRSEVAFESHYSFVSIDPPELRKHIFEMRKDPANHLTVDMPTQSLRSAILAAGMMPLRNKRFCCDVLKEQLGAGRSILTGIRWQESQRRKKRKMREACRRNGLRFFLNPIIHWKTSEIWKYIRDRNLPYCQLYDEGWKRLGCVLCPMTRDTERQIARWPKIAGIWRKISDAIYASRENNIYPTAEAYWQWWLNRDAKARTAEDDECPLFDGTLE